MKKMKGRIRKTRRIWKNKHRNKLWTKLCQAQGRNYVLISLVIENLDPKINMSKFR